MHELRRLRGSKKIFALSLLSIFAFSWSALYFSSLYQLRKAERLVADLRTFPFATADFAEVRDFVFQHGGIAMQELPQTPPSACTVQDCMFQIWLGRPFSRPPTNQWVWQSLYPTLPYLGLRPWTIYAQFEVRSGVLMRSITTVGQLRRKDIIEYSIHTERTVTPFFRSDELTNDYAVVVPHVTGPPTEALIAWVLQTPDAPMNQVFDVDLRCFTTIFHGCSDLGALAPSAWQHYRGKMKTP
jgi:hypothetical protein